MSDPDRTDEAPPETDRTSLAAGVVFVALGALFLADQWVSWDLEARWLWPVLLIVIGALGLLSGSRRSR